jgi:DNA-binding response OmpR family regulator
MNDCFITSALPVFCKSVNLSANALQNIYSTDDKLTEFSRQAQEFLTQPLTFAKDSAIMWNCNRVPGETRMKQFRILVVDDEKRIVNFLNSKLRASGYDVLTAGDGFEALEQAQAQEPDLILLDILMPKMDGFETLKRLRSFSSTPVIILSAKGADIDKIKGLGLGADDYLPKPFNPDELIARIEAVKRRIKPSDRRKTTELLSLGDLRVDFKARKISLGKEEKYLTRIEWLLLSELTNNIGRLMPYEELLSLVWGPEYRDDVQLLRTWISRLRAKLEKNPDNPQLISTVPKAGYIMNRNPLERR